MIDDATRLTCQGRVAEATALIQRKLGIADGDAAKGSYTDSRGPDASAEMIRFFAEHCTARPAAEARPFR